jgi:hypothetical protein
MLWFIDYDYPFGIFKLYLNILKNISLVFINDCYIDVLGSFTFDILNCSLTPGKLVCIYIFGIMARTSYLLRKVYVVTMTWLTIRITSVTTVPFVAIAIVHSFPHLCLNDESRDTATCFFFAKMIKPDSILGNNDWSMQKARYIVHIYFHTVGEIWRFVLPKKVVFHIKCTKFSRLYCVVDIILCQMDLFVFLVDLLISVVLFLFYFFIFSIRVRIVYG